MLSRKPENSSDSETALSLGADAAERHAPDSNIRNVQQLVPADSSEVEQIRKTIKAVFEEIPPGEVYEDQLSQSVAKASGALTSYFLQLREAEQYVVTDDEQGALEKYQETALILSEFLERALDGKKYTSDGMILDREGANYNLLMQSVDWLGQNISEGGEFLQKLASRARPPGIEIDPNTALSKEANAFSELKLGKESLFDRLKDGAVDLCTKAWIFLSKNPLLKKTVVYGGATGAGVFFWHHPRALLLLAGVVAGTAAALGVAAAVSKLAERFSGGGRGGRKGWLSKLFGGGGGLGGSGDTSFADLHFGAGIGNSSGGRITTNNDSFYSAMPATNVRIVTGRDGQLRELSKFTRDVQEANPGDPLALCLSEFTKSGTVPSLSEGFSLRREESVLSKKERKDKKKLIFVGSEQTLSEVQPYIVEDGDVRQSYSAKLKSVLIEDSPKGKVYEVTWEGEEVVQLGYTIRGDFDDVHEEVSSWPDGYSLEKMRLPKNLREIRKLSPSFGEVIVDFKLSKVQDRLPCPPGFTCTALSFYNKKGEEIPLENDVELEQGALGAVTLPQPPPGAKHVAYMLVPEAPRRFSKDAINALKHFAPAFETFRDKEEVIWNNELAKLDVEDEMKSELLLSRVRKRDKYLYSLSPEVGRLINHSKENREEVLSGLRVGSCYTMSYDISRRSTEVGATVLILEGPTSDREHNRFDINPGHAINVLPSSNRATTTFDLTRSTDRMFVPKFSIFSGHFSTAKANI